MLEADQLSYCNKQADSFFGVSLSHLPQTDTLHNSQYQIMDKRCLHELKKNPVVCESHGSTIGETELGERVLTLSEVIQTFEVESGMFDLGSRIVVFTKRKVEIDGREKLIVMIRDVTDRQRLE